MLKKNPKLLEMMNNIDEKYIDEAEKAKFLPQKNIWKRVGSIAASLALVAAIGTFPFWGNLNQPEIGPEIPNGTTNETTNKTEDFVYLYADYVWDAEKGVFKLSTEGKGDNAEIQKEPEYNLTTEATTTTGDSDGKHTPDVLYPYIMGEFSSYELTKKAVAPNYVGESLGTVTMGGKDGRTLEAELFAIVGMDTKCAVTVKYPQYDYRVFRNPDMTFDTLADFKTAYSFDTEIYMGEVLVTHSMADRSESLSELKSIAPLKAMILELDGKACTKEEFTDACDMAKSIGVKVIHGSQFVRSGGLQVFADGYLVTNLDGTLRIFDIGKDSAQEIIADVEKNKYDGVEIYTEKRDVIEKSAFSAELDIPETSGGYQGVLETAEEQPPYGLTTPSYDPHKTKESEPYAPADTVLETVVEETNREEPLYGVNQPSYEGHDPYAWTTTEETMVYETNPLIYEGYDPYAWKH